jgi:YHS domain-containing protein
MRFEHFIIKITSKVDLGAQMKKIKSVLRDPVCGQKINKNKAHFRTTYRNRVYYLCCPLCQASFEKDPNRYIKE